MEHTTVELTVCQDSLFHWETLFVVAAGNAQHVALPFVTQLIGLNLSAHTLLVEDAQLMFVDDLEQFLVSRSGT